MMKRKWMTLLCCAAVGLAVGTSQVLKGLAQSAAGDAAGTTVPAVEAALAETADAEADGPPPAALEQGGDVSAVEPAAEAPAVPADEPAGESPADDPAPEAPVADEPAAVEPADEPSETPTAAPAASVESGPSANAPSVSTEPAETAPTEPTEPAETTVPAQPNATTGPGATEPSETPTAPSKPAVPAPSEPAVAAPARPGETAATAAPAASTAETWAVTYVLRAGDAGTLPFDTAAVEKGRAIGAGRVPAPVLPDGIELSGYAVGGRVLTAAELAAYVPDRDTAVEVRTRKIEKQPVYDPSWDVPPAWAGSGRDHMRSNLSAAAEQRRLAAQLDERIRDVRSALKLSDAVAVEAGTDHFAEVLAVYAVMSGQTDGFPYGVVIRDVTQLRHIYWSMTQVTGMSNHQTARIGVRRLSVTEAAGVLGLTAEQQARASELAASGAAAVRAWSEVDALSRLSDDAVAATADRARNLSDTGRP